MKIIIIGCGKVGSSLVSQLAEEKHDVTIIDTNVDKLRQVSDAKDVMCIEGSGMNTEVLMQAGLEDTDLLIATTDSDEKNVLCCLIASSNAENCQTIARVRKPEYQKEFVYLKDKMNLKMLLNPEQIAASDIYRLMRYPASVIKCDRFAKGRVDMLTIEVPKNSIIDGIRIKDLQGFTRCNVLVCAVERNDNVYIPSGDFVLHAEDVISFVGNKSQQMDFLSRLKLDTGITKSVMICGGSKIAYYVAKLLLAEEVTVKIIDWDIERCKQLSETLENATIINGDATDEQLLMEEGLQDVDTLLTLTGLDEENIMISLYARSVSDCKVITKINRITFEDVIKSLDLGSVVNPKLITADHITRYVRGMQNGLGSKIETLYTFASGNGEALEFRVTEEFEEVNKPIMNIPLKKGVLIACINRKGNVIIPGGQDIMCNEDTVIIVTTNMGLKDLNDILEKEE